MPIHMAAMAELAYHTEAFVRHETTTHFGYEECIWHAKGGTEMFVARHESYILISFRGTKGIRDILTDLFFSQTSAPGDADDGNDRRGHRGFKGALEDVWNLIMGDLSNIPNHRDLKIFLTGHSLGAAIAQLAGYRLDALGENVAGIYAFGSPRIGNKHFAKTYQERLGTRTFPHINNKDIITSIPPAGQATGNLKNR